MERTLRTGWIMLAALGVIGAREVGVVDLRFAKAESTRQVSATAVRVPGVDGESNALALDRRPLAIHVTGGNGVVHRAAAGALPTATRADAVRVDLDLRVDDPFCFLPLYKRATVDFSGRGEARSPAGEPEVSVDLAFTGSVTRQALGFESCRSFREEVGEAVADAIRGRLKEALD
jgi:hypothetical protein